MPTPTFQQPGSGSIAESYDTVFQRVVYAEQFGAVADYNGQAAQIVQHATISASSTNLTASTANFVTGDVGKTISVSGAGPSGATLVTMIASVSSPIAATLATAAATTVTDAAIIYGGGSISASSTTLNLPLETFTTGDIGKTIAVAGVGASGATLVTTIASVLSGTTVTLSTAASTAMTNGTVIYGTDNGPPIQAAFNSVSANNNALAVELGAGQYLVATTITIPAFARLYTRKSAALLAGRDIDMLDMSGSGTVLDSVSCVGNATLFPNARGCVFNSTAGSQQRHYNCNFQNWGGYPVEFTAIEVGRQFEADNCIYNKANGGAGVKFSAPAEFNAAE